MKNFFVGVDSDGTAFDTMSIKHKKAFIPGIISVWNLENIKDEVIETCEYINLYSKNRGINRFPGLIMTFEMLKSKGHVMPDFGELEKFVASGKKMANKDLIEYIEENNSVELKKVLEWSELADEIFAREVKNLKPIENVRETLKKAYERAGIGIISAASTKGLLEDWSNGDIIQYTDTVLGQEFGSKKVQLAHATEGKYDSDKILMIGDAVGDLQAAKENNALFYPIIPNKEAESWQKLNDEVLDLFFSGGYEGAAEEKLVGEFYDSLL